jgi:hypothetical protein
MRFCLVILCSACASAQALEGTLINSITGGGIGSVKVEIVQDSDTIRTCLTDQNGHFSVDDLNDGPYIARYATADYTRGVGSRPSLSMQGARMVQEFKVIAGADTVKLEAHMTPLAKLTVHVVDGRGDAVPHARVIVRGPGLLSSGPADANGKYTLQQFAFPGAYKLAAFPTRDMKAPDPEPDSDGVLGWTRIFYPGVTSPEAATNLIVRPGETREVELRLVALPAHAVRGILLKPDGTPAAKVAINLGETPFVGMWSAQSKADGTFECFPVSDGDWILSAKIESDGVSFQATESIQMRGRDINGVKIYLSAPFTVSGRVLIETPQGMVAPAMPNMVMLSELGPEDDPDFALPARQYPVHPDADGLSSLAAHIRAATVSWRQI